MHWSVFRISTITDLGMLMTVVIRSAMTMLITKLYAIVRKFLFCLLTVITNIFPTKEAMIITNNAVILVTFSSGVTLFAGGQQHSLFRQERNQYHWLYY